MTDPTQRARAAWAARINFLALGMIGGVWGVHIPSAKARFALDDRGVAALLAATTVGSLLSLTQAGRAVARWGARRVAAWGGAVACAMLALSLSLPGAVWLACALATLGAARSLLDVAANAESALLERLEARPIVSGLHAMFSVGGMSGAAIAAGLLRLEVAAPTQLLVLGVALGVTLVFSGRAMLDAHPAPAPPLVHAAGPPRGQLLTIGVLVAIGLMAEGIMYNWSVLYAQDELHLPQAVAALAYVSFASAMAMTRLVGDRVRARWSARRILTAGSSLAAIAIGATLLLGRPWAAFAGFACAGIGMATVIPVLYTSAARVRGVSAAVALASVASVGTVGTLVGPPIVGAVAHASSLTMGMAVVTLALVVLMVGARWLPRADDGSGRA